jgi:hypothetical protein
MSVDIAPKSKEIDAVQNSSAAAKEAIFLRKPWKRAESEVRAAH